MLTPDCCAGMGTRYAAAGRLACARAAGVAAAGRAVGAAAGAAAAAAELAGAGRAARVAGAARTAAGRRRAAGLRQRGQAGAGRASGLPEEALWRRQVSRSALAKASDVVGKGRSVGTNRSEIVAWVSGQPASLLRFIGKGLSSMYWIQVFVVKLREVDLLTPCPNGLLHYSMLKVMHILCTRQTYIGHQVVCCHVPACCSA